MFILLVGTDMHFPILGNVAQQDAQAERDGEQALDGTAQRARSLRLAEPLTAEQIDGTVIDVQREALFEQARAQFIDLQARDGANLGLIERMEDDYLIDAVEKLRAEGFAQALHQALAWHLLDRVFMIIGAEAGRGATKQV